MKKEKMKRKITPGLVMKAIEDSGGVKKVIAERLGVKYGRLDYKLRKGEGEKWDNVRLALELEEERVLDIAEITVKEMMQQRLDQNVASTTARWLLEKKKRGYEKKSQMTLDGGKNPLKIENVLPIDKLNLPLETKKQILIAMEEYEKENEEGKSE